MTTDDELRLHETMAAINSAWRGNRPSDMLPYLHARMTLVLPGFSGTVTGSDALLAGFEEWCANAKVLQYEESDEQLQIIGNVGFVSYRFDMLYERAAYRERSVGRDVWAFERIDRTWLAVWRTMVDLKEERTPMEVKARAKRTGYS